MARQLTFILGGARSGKSTHAEALAAADGGDVLYVATAQAWDEEMAARIAAHQAERPPHWQTLEASQQVGAAIHAHLERASSAPTVVLVDCLTLLANHVLMALPQDAGQATVNAALQTEVDALLAVYAQTEAHWIVVSNEVGLGIVPAFRLGRVYRDALGRANQQLAARADTVLFMVAGLPMVVKGKV